MTRRVVVTGLGIVSSLGNSVEQVLNALQHGHSGIAVQPSFIERGMRSHVAGVPDLSQAPEIPRRARRFMADSAAYAYHAMTQAMHDAGFTEATLSHPRVGLIMGAGVGSLVEQASSLDVLRTKGIEKIGPYSVPKVMTSTASANLASEFRIQGMSFSVSSACASSGHALGLAADYIRWGKQDVIFAGGAEEVAWPSAMLFDGMGVLSTRVADPSASCPYDADRDGFVIAGGAGVLVLEEFEHAKRRNATVYAELTGYGVCSDGGGMVNPDPAGAERAMRQALEEAGHAVQYINTHATSTPIGDLSELKAVEALFGADVPWISSTKGLSGHAIGAAAVHEAIYSILMLQSRFIAGNANLNHLDPACKHLPLVGQTVPHPIQAFMTNSFGFGGTNVSLVFKR